MSLVRIALVFSLLLNFAWADNAPIQLTEKERLITILGTNDIHGGVEPSSEFGGPKFGGLALLSGTIQSIRKKLTEQYGDKAGTLLLDGGDQFQGTLLSNYNEGQLVFAIMKQIGYDAAVLGNHDYDFGPTGWLDDEVNDKNPDKNPRGALEELVKTKSVLLLSANTFFKGKPGVRPAFAKPYEIKNVAGVRVALIGIDNVHTPRTTKYANVADLEFADEFETYVKVRQELEGKADLFVMVVHDGNSRRDFGMTRIVQRLAAKGPNFVHAVVAGHTHDVNDLEVDGVPIIQSGSGGRKFGRIDLVWDTESRALVLAKQRHVAGIALDGTYEGQAVQPDPAVQRLIDDARRQVAHLAGRKLGEAKADLPRHRTDESPLLDVLTDQLRQVTGADVAILNTGGVRDDLPKGPIDYETFFQVFPISNHAVTVGPMPIEQLIEALQASVKTCGVFGSLMQSGLRVTYTRDCERAVNEYDKNAKLVRVETLKGETLYDVQKETSLGGRKVTVATVDFLATGGEASGPIGHQPVLRDFGILREILADEMAKHPVVWTEKMDDRWKRVTGEK